MAIQTRMGLFVFSCVFGVFVSASSSIAMSLNERTLVYESYTMEAQGQYATAAGKMVEVLKNNPNDYFVHYRLGWLFSLAKRYKNSSEHYDKAASISPTSVEPWLALSSLYVNLGDYPSALKCSEELVKRDPHSYFGMLRQNLSLLRMKQYSAALEKVNESIKLYPIDATFLEQKGYILKEMGRQDEARDVASTLIVINPKNEFAKTFLSSK